MYKHTYIYVTVYNDLSHCNKNLSKFLNFLKLPCQVRTKSLCKFK